MKEEGGIKIHNRWRLALKVLPIVFLILIIKLSIIVIDAEFLSLSSLFTALISANIFLIGFLVTGTLSDYKESEKLPGDLASSLETMADEGLILYESKKSPEAKEYLKSLLNLNKGIIEWFYDKKDLNFVFSKIKSLNLNFIQFEPLTQANFIARLKQEQNALRKSVNRINTIRTTSFLATGYVIAEIITGATITGLIFVDIDSNFIESLFFTLFVSYILIYMLFFIKDLDNPFGYENIEESSDEVSLRPLIQSKETLETYLKDLD